MWTFSGNLEPPLNKAGHRKATAKDTSETISNDIHRLKCLEVTILQLIKMTNHALPIACISCISRGFVTTVPTGVH